MIPILKHLSVVFVEYMLDILHTLRLRRASFLSREHGFDVFDSMVLIVYILSIIVVLFRLCLDFVVKRRP